MPALVVEVVGDTKKLTAELTKAEAQLKRFAGRASSWDKRTPQTGRAGSLIGELEDLQQVGNQTIATSREVGAEADAAGSSLGGMGLKAGVAGLAVYALGRNLEQAGGGLGKFGKAMSALTSGDFVGFAKAASDNTEEAKGFEASLLKTGDALKAGKLAAELAAIGWDTYAEAALRASKALQQVNDRLVDPTKTHDSAAVTHGVLSGQEPSTLPLKKPFKPKPLTSEQRRGFFDARVGRLLDRVQDIKSVSGQVAALKKIAALIQDRMDATKDVTRRLNLEDQLVQVNRQAARIVATAAADASREQAAATAKQEAAARDAAEKTRRLNEARRDHIAALKEAADVARQTHLEWLEFALERADVTKPLADDLKAQQAIIGFYKQRIKAEGRKLELVRELWRAEQALKTLQQQRKAAAPKIAVPEVFGTGRNPFGNGGAVTGVAHPGAARAGSGTDALVRRGGGFVVVNQHFNAPTTDRHREARYALNATRAVFDG